MRWVGLSGKVFFHSMAGWIDGWVNCMGFVFIWDAQLRSKSRLLLRHAKNMAMAEEISLLI